MHCRVRDNSRASQLTVLLQAAQALPSKLCRGVAHVSCADGGWYISSTSLCRTVSVSSFAASSVVLAEYELEDGLVSFGINLPSLAAALKDCVGSEVTFNGAAITVSRSDGCLKLKTQVQVIDTGVMADVDVGTFEAAGEAAVGTLTINADLLEYCLQEIQATVSSPNSDSLVSLKVDIQNGLDASVVDNATGLSCSVRVPSRSFKLEGYCPALTFKAWALLCMLRFANNTGSSSLLRIDLYQSGLRLVVRLPDSGDSRCELRLLSST
jgi:hypothetical protein